MLGFVGFLKKKLDLEGKLPDKWKNLQNLLLDAEEYTSNKVEGKYEISVLGASYGSDKIYRAFVQEIWDGQASNPGNAPIISYKRLDNKMFPACETSLKVPFISYRWAITTMFFETYDVNGNKLESFRSDFDRIDLNTWKAYTMDLAITKPYAEFKITYMAASYSPYNPASQNRIGQITLMGRI